MNLSRDRRSTSRSSADLPRQRTRSQSQVARRCPREDLHSSASAVVIQQHLASEFALKNPAGAFLRGELGVSPCPSRLHGFGIGFGSSKGQGSDCDHPPGPEEASAINMRSAAFGPTALPDVAKSDGAPSPANAEVAMRLRRCRNRRQCFRPYYRPSIGAPRALPHATSVRGEGRADSEFDVASRHIYSRSASINGEGRRRRGAANSTGTLPRRAPSLRRRPFVPTPPHPTPFPLTTLPLPPGSGNRVFMLGPHRRTVKQQPTRASPSRQHFTLRGVAAADTLRAGVIDFDGSVLDRTAGIRYSLAIQTLLNPPAIRSTCGDTVASSHRSSGRKGYETLEKVGPPDQRRHAAQPHSL